MMLFLNLTEDLPNEIKGEEEVCQRHTRAMGQLSPVGHQTMPSIGCILEVQGLRRKDVFRRVTELTSQ